MIWGYVGLIGQGKTMLAVRDAIELARRRGAILASNIGIQDPGVEFVRLSVGDEGLEGIPELLERASAEGRGVVLLLDEIGIILPARFWQTAMSIDLMWACSQSRKLGADMIFTAQDASQIDRFLRLLTDHVWKCRAVPAPTIERRERGRRPWFFMLGKFRPADSELARPEKRLGRQWVRYPRAWEGVYNTDELVRPPKRLRDQGTARPSSSRRRSGVPSPEVQETDAGFSTPSPEGPERSGGPATPVDGGEVPAGSLAFDSQ